MKQRHDPIGNQSDGTYEPIEARKKADEECRKADRNSSIALALSILSLVFALLGLLARIVETCSNLR